MLSFSYLGPTSRRCIKSFWVSDDHPACAATAKDPMVSCQTCACFTSQGQRGGRGVHRAPSSRSLKSVHCRVNSSDVCSASREGHTTLSGLLWNSELTPRHALGEEISSFMIHQMSVLYCRVSLEIMIRLPVCVRAF